MNDIINTFIKKRRLSPGEYEELIKSYSPENAELLKKEADRLRREVYGNRIFIRGLIEISNICKNDCLYCGIRKSNKSCSRYRLTKEEILLCCERGYSLGFRTFVLQGGEDGFFTVDFLTDLIKEIKSRYPDCAVTLSLGEKTKQDYIEL